jgi:hypothetical protein
MPIQMDFIQKYFKYLHLLRLYIILPSKIFWIRKTAALCVVCGLRYSSNNLQSFDTHALYCVHPLYITYTDLLGPKSQDLSYILIIVKT